MKATVYFRGEFIGSIHKIYGEVSDYGTMKWAQFDAAPFVQITPKRKRKARKFVKADYQPYMLIVEGEGPEPDSLYGDPVVHGQVEISRSRYSSHSEGWVNDFDAMINPMIESGKVKVIADYRYTTKKSHKGRMTVEDKSEETDDSNRCYFTRQGLRSLET